MSPTWEPRFERVPKADKGYHSFFWEEASSCNIWGKIVFLVNNE